MGLLSNFRAGFLQRVAYTTKTVIFGEISWRNFHLDALPGVCTLLDSPMSSKLGRGFVRGGVLSGGLYIRYTVSIANQLTSQPAGRKKLQGHPDDNKDHPLRSSLASSVDLPTNSVGVCMYLFEDKVLGINVRYFPINVRYPPFFAVPSSPVLVRSIISLLRACAAAAACALIIAVEKREWEYDTSIAFDCYPPRLLVLLLLLVWVKCFCLICILLPLLLLPLLLLPLLYLVTARRLVKEDRKRHSSQQKNRPHPPHTDIESSRRTLKALQLLATLKS